MEKHLVTASALDIQLSKAHPLPTEWHTINFRKLRHTLSSPVYTSFSQWTTGNMKSVARHLRTLQYVLRAPDEEVTVCVAVESLDKGASYIPYLIDDCAVFMAATPLSSSHDPSYDAGSDPKPGNHRWQRSQITVRGSANIYCCFGFRLANRSVRIRITALHGDQQAEHVLCVAVSGGSTQSVEQSRKRQVPNSASGGAAKRVANRSPSPPLILATLPVVSAQQDLAALQKLLRCGQWLEFDHHVPNLRHHTMGPCALQAQILMSCRYIYTSTATELADPHHTAWREFTKADRALFDKIETNEVKYLAHLLSLYRKARTPFTGQHMWAFDRLHSLLTHSSKITPADTAAGYVALALAPAPTMDEHSRILRIQQAIKIYCELNHPDELANVVISLCSLRMARRHNEHFVDTDPHSHIPPGPWPVLGAEYEQVCCDMRQLNHKVMSLLTQTNYWLVWADVLLRGGRVALATQMALHCVKVAESVQPPLIGKVAAARERLAMLRNLSSATSLQRHHQGDAIVPAALLLELGLSAETAAAKRPSSHSPTQAPSATPAQASHATQPPQTAATAAYAPTNRAQAPQPLTQPLPQAQPAVQVQHAHAHPPGHSHHHSHAAQPHVHTSSHGPHPATDPHGHLHSGHVHAELHAHSGHVHSHHTHGKGVAAVISRPLAAPHHTGTSGPCSHKLSDALAACAPCSPEKAPVCLEEIHCDGECCELLDWEVQLANCCCVLPGSQDV